MKVGEAAAKPTDSSKTDNQVEMYYTGVFFFFFWLRWVFIAARGLSLAVASGGLLFVAVRGLLCGGFSHCGAQALGVWASVVVARRLSS